LPSGLRKDFIGGLVGLLLVLVYYGVDTALGEGIGPMLSGIFDYRWMGCSGAGFPGSNSPCHARHFRLMGWYEIFVAHNLTEKQHKSAPRTLISTLSEAGYY
jgi:hypothetical protein